MFDNKLNSKSESNGPVFPSDFKCNLLSEKVNKTIHGIYVNRNKLTTQNYHLHVPILSLISDMCLSNVKL